MVALLIYFIVFCSGLNISKKTIAFLRDYLEKTVEKRQLIDY